MPRGRLALDLQMVGDMKSYIGEIVRCLLEMHALEERRAALPQDRTERANAEALIESLRSNLPMNVALAHDRLRAAGQRSVAEVRHGVCTRCHMTVPLEMLAALRLSESPARCENCGRFIYLVEEEPSDQQPARRAVRHAATLKGA
jgi:predicted  nucleic acid-binding Zn-ribbon protein